MARTARYLFLAGFGAKWKWSGYADRMNDSRWSNKGTERQIKNARSVGRPKRRWGDDVVGQLVISV